MPGPTESAFSLRRSEDRPAPCPAQAPSWLHRARSPPALLPCKASLLGQLPSIASPLLHLPSIISPASPPPSVAPPPSNSRFEAPNRALRAGVRRRLLPRIWWRPLERPSCSLLPCTQHPLHLICPSLPECVKKFAGNRSLPSIFEFFFVCTTLTTAIYEFAWFFAPVLHGVPGATARRYYRQPKCHYRCLSSCGGQRIPCTTA